MPFPNFHPAVVRWFLRRFALPTEAQVRAWPEIQAGRHTLVAAPTGSGKTLTAFLAAIDDLVRRGVEAAAQPVGPGRLPDQVQVVYVSPLKALSNDIRVNLELPLSGIRAELAAMGLPDVEIRSAVRTGDTAASERQKSLRRPPHILVTTPESLYVLLGSPSGRNMLSSVRTVIVDEIHALAPNKRGSHLALSLERLRSLCGQAPLRIGLSATQKPIETVARFLVGAEAECAIVDVGHQRSRDLALELPPTPLSAVMSGDQWTQVHARIAELAHLHRTTLVFVNTRRMAERIARHLAERLGRDRVAAHHGSLSRAARLDAEQRLKTGQLQLLVATASLELGLDIGEVDLVCQIGSPRSIAAFLQRAGRAGHAVGGISKARLFPQTRDELVECAALLDAVQRGELDTLKVPSAPLDVLAQHIVAETACAEWDEDQLYGMLCRAMPYAALTRERHDAVLRMLSEGYATRQGRRGAYVHRDAVNRRLRERRGSRLVALTSGGTIPETGDYTVILEPQADKIGSVNEDFAVESLAGDVFQLGNISYRILRIEAGRVRVEDARGAAPNIPFWLGEAPGRSDELSFAVARWREEAAHLIEREGRGEAVSHLMRAQGLTLEAARQLVDYVASILIALGGTPSQSRLVLERFFDASGGMQLVLHTPFGSRINRAWGLALRKRFCRQFNFELQAAATEDAIVLSLSTSHSFVLEEVARYLHSATALDVLVQALLDAPLFSVRWRWNATTALALPRFSGGRKVAPQLQRMRSEDLLASVFPDQLACAENLSGPREVPEHPLVEQTMRDCLEDAMDAPGWLQVLKRLESGDIEVVARDLPAPSPLAMEALQARPYAFLDDAPLEERRTQAVRSRRYGEIEDVDELGRLDPDAIACVRREAWPEARHADELHEALLMLGALTDAELQQQPGWQKGMQALAAAGRAVRVVPAAAEPMAAGLWMAAERIGALACLYPNARLSVPLQSLGPQAEGPLARQEALSDLLRSRLSGLGPVTAERLADALQLPPSELRQALERLRQEGSVFEARITPDARESEWCEQHLLARIHRYTLNRLRQEIEPVEARDFVRFLFEWQHLSPQSRLQGPQSLSSLLAQLEGFEAPAALWESELLPARLADYVPAWLDDLCSSGRLLWQRLRPATAAAGARGAAVSLRATPIVLLPRRAAPGWAAVAALSDPPQPLGSKAQRVLEHLQSHGACFFDDLLSACRLLPTELETALAEGVARGRLHCDSFAGLRALVLPPSQRKSSAAMARRRAAWLGIEQTGRWSALPQAEAVGLEANGVPAGPLEPVALALLRRHGVVCWRLLANEAAWLPPWRELVQVYRRLEARGEIRGGRFIAGVSGEQFALPEAVTALRQVRRQAHVGSWVCLAAADPANLLGTLLAGERVPRVAGSRVLYLDGLPVAVRMAGRIQWLQELQPALRQAGQALLELDPVLRSRHAASIGSG